MRLNWFPFKLYFLTSTVPFLLKYHFLVKKDSSLFHLSLNPVHLAIRVLLFKWQTTLSNRQTTIQWIGVNKSAVLYTG